MSVLNIIRDIIANKTAKRKHPNHALRLEVISKYDGSIQKMDEEIKELLDFYVIIAHRTINDTAYEITEL